MIKNIIFDIGNVLVKFQPDQAMRDLGIDEVKIPKMAQATYLNPIWGELDRGVMQESEVIDEMVKVAPEYEEEIRLFFRDGKDKVVKAFDYATDWIKELQSRESLKGVIISGTEIIRFICFPTIRKIILNCIRTTSLILHQSWMARLSPVWSRW